MGASVLMAGHRRANGWFGSSRSLLLLAFVLGCGHDAPQSVPDTGRSASASPVLDPARAMDAPIADLEAAYRAAERDAERFVATEDGVRHARRAAALARIWSLRDEARASAHLDDARRLLREAARRKALDGACDAAVDLARLEARDAVDLTAAYAIAYRAGRRFASVRGTRNCVEEARRITSTLEAFRPSAAELAAIDADPDADDPSAGTATPSANDVDASAVDVTAWARARGDTPGTGPAAQLASVSVYGQRNAEVVRVVLHFDRVALFRRGELPAADGLPRRAYLDLAGTTLAPRVTRATPVGAAGLRRVRAAMLQPDTARIAFDLDDDARYRLFFLPDPYRIVVDFERGAPAVAVAPGQPRDVRTIVLDPGHGANDYGARGANGLVEAVLTLELAKRVRTILQRRLPDVRVVLTRERDVLMGLEERVAMANGIGADLFVSIHLNDADVPVENGGVTTFVLDTTDDRAALRLAARENGTTANEVTGLQRILAGLHREDQVRASRSLAELVQRATVASGRRELPRLRDRGIKSAMFYVLVGARMPAVLVEASFLSDPDEMRALETPRYRLALAEGMADGIVRYARGE
jgi:N-acetylmuramoyl-L-alanine amidase